MKKFITGKIIILSLILFSISANASGVKPCDINFSPGEGRKYIYANNNEAIRRIDLSDTSNPNPTYLMNNYDLGKDKYAVFISHLNNTFLNDGRYNELGFDIEVDMLFIAKTDLVFNISAVGFEVVDKRQYYENGDLVKYEDSWSCLDAWSTYLKIPIFQKDGRKYYPKEFKPTQIELKKGEQFWLSKILPDYREVPYLKAVHILADFEIISGVADVNVAALKHNGRLFDRTHHAKDASHGIYYRDKQYKGIAQSNRMDTSLSFVIDDSVKSGTYLPVTVYNQFNPKGNRTDKWMTNINPQADKWSRDISTESDMITLKYFDESLLGYYGDNIPKKERSPYWIFDVFHSDTELYDGSTEDYRNYRPNYKLTPDNTNLDVGCNLGNYGVSLYYNITIDNKGKKERFVNYHLNTSSGNIIILRDENGEMVQDFALCKGNRNDKTEEILASVKLPPNKKTKFILQVLLPTNAAGGMENSLVISDSEEKIEINDLDRIKTQNKYIFTGKEYLQWNEGVLYSTTDFETWNKKPISLIAKELFENNWNSFDILETDGGYMVRNSQYDGSPNMYRNILYRHNRVCFFDKNFHLMAQQKFDDFPTDMAYAKGIYYVKAGECYYSPDMVKWKKLGTKNTPVYAGGRFCAIMKDGDLYLSADGKMFYKSTHKAAYINALKGAYYYTDEDSLFVSSDGVYWQEHKLNSPVKSVHGAVGFIIADGVKIKMPPSYDKIWVKLKGEILAFDAPPATENGRTLVPIRYLTEKLGFEVSWDEETKTAKISGADKIIEFIIGSNAAYINGEPILMDTEAKQLSFRTYVPLRFVAETFGLNVHWDKELMLVEID